MTPKEFNEWLEDYSAAFPGTADWIDKLADKQRTLKHWLHALTGTDLADAIAVTERMTEGREDVIKPYDREQTAVLIAKLAERVKAGRRWQPKREEWKPELGKPHWSMVEMFKAVRAGLAQGKTAAELVKELVPDDDAETAPRYRCLECRDFGTIQVWSNQSIRAVMKSQERIPMYSAVCRCNCAAGARRVGLEFYDAAKYCRFNGFRDLQSLRDWCADYEENRVKNMRNYTPAFESF